MDLSGKRIGFALTGSYCTFSQVIPQIERLKNMGAEILPILSYNVASSDTRFMKCADLKQILKDITQNDIIETITGAEPIGPKKLLDILIVAPCTGNSLAKIALGVTDTPVTMAVKAHLRNARPVLIAVSSNDSLSTNGKNIGLLSNTKNMFFVPCRQDNYTAKVDSLVADMQQIPECAMLALDNEQKQPVLLAPMG